ncbi:Hypothetical protein, putative, partial [Bodo saltans]
DAATHCMQRFLAAPTKFATETLIPQLARRYPCEAGDDAARLEMSDLSVMDIVFFLKHRLGLEFNFGSKRFEVPGGMNDSVSATVVGEATVKLRASVVGYSHREVMIPASATVLGEVCEELSWPSQKDTAWRSNLELSASLMLALYYAAMLVDRPNGEHALKVILLGHQFKREHLNPLTYFTVSEMRRYLFPLRDVNTNRIAPVGSYDEVALPIEGSLLGMFPIGRVEAVVSDMGVDHMGECAQHNSSSKFVCSPFLLRKTIQRTSPSDYNWVYRLVACFVDTESGTFPDIEPALPLEQSSRLLMVWAEAIVFRNFQNSVDALPKPPQCERSATAAPQLATTLPSTMTSVPESYFQLVDVPAALFLSTMLSADRWKSLMRWALVPSALSSTLPTASNVVVAEVPAGRCHWNEAMQVVQAMCSCAVRLLGGEAAVKRVLSTDFAKKSPRKNEKKGVSQLALSTTLRVPISVSGQRRIVNQLDLIDQLATILVSTGTRLDGATGGDSSSVAIVAALACAVLPRPDPRVWALLCSLSELEMVPRCCQESLQCLLAVRFLREVQQEGSRDHPDDANIVDSSASVPTAVDFVFRIFEADSEFTISVLEKYVLRKNATATQRETPKSFSSTLSVHDAVDAMMNTFVTYRKAHASKQTAVGRQPGLPDGSFVCRACAAKPMRPTSEIDALEVLECLAAEDAPEVVEIEVKPEKIEEEVTPLPNDDMRPAQERSASPEPPTSTVTTVTAPSTPPPSSPLPTTLSLPFVLNDFDDASFLVFCAKEAIAREIVEDLLLTEIESLMNTHEVIRALQLSSQAKVIRSANVTPSSQHFPRPSGMNEVYPNSIGAPAKKESDHADSKVELLRSVVLQAMTSREVLMRGAIEQQEAALRRRTFMTTI